MKISKSALKRIVRQELLREFAPSGGGDGSDCKEWRAEIERVAGASSSLDLDALLSPTSATPARKRKKKKESVLEQYFRLLAEQVEEYNMHEEAANDSERWVNAGVLKKDEKTGKLVRIKKFGSSFTDDQYDLHINFKNRARKNIIMIRDKIKNAVEYLEEHIKAKPECKTTIDNVEEILGLISDIKAEFFDDSGLADAVSDALKGL